MRRLRADGRMASTCEGVSAGRGGVWRGNAEGVYHSLARGGQDRAVVGGRCPAADTSGVRGPRAGIRLLQAPRPGGELGARTRSSLASWALKCSRRWLFIAACISCRRGERARGGDGGGVRVRGRRHPSEGPPQPDGLAPGAFQSAKAIAIPHFSLPHAPSQQLLSRWDVIEWSTEVRNQVPTAKLRTWGRWCVVLYCSRAASSAR